MNSLIQDFYTKAKNQLPDSGDNGDNGDNGGNE